MRSRVTAFPLLHLLPAREDVTSLDLFLLHSHELGPRPHAPQRNGLPSLNPRGKITLSSLKLLFPAFSSYFITAMRTATSTRCGQQLGCCFTANLGSEEKGRHIPRAPSRSLQYFLNEALPSFPMHNWNSRNHKQVRSPSPTPPIPVLYVL